MYNEEKELTFDHFPTEEELKASLFSLSSDDPKSLYYDRKLTYPKIKWWLVIINILLGLSLIVGSFLISYFIIKNIYAMIFIPLGVFILLMIIFIKPITIFLVHLYQLLAPTSIRMKCRFEPSCSEYMILAINKYGFIKGIKKGINRLKRCHYPNGGYDEP